MISAVKPTAGRQVYGLVFPIASSILGSTAQFQSQWNSQGLQSYVRKHGHTHRYHQDREQEYESSGVDSRFNEFGKIYQLFDSGKYKNKLFSRVVTPK